MKYSAENLLVRPSVDPRDADLALTISPERAGWSFLSFQVRRLAQGKNWSFDTGEHELVLVNLSGSYAVTSNRGQWDRLGGRQDVFAGAADLLYLPRHTHFKVAALESGEFAVAWAPASTDRDPFLIKEEQVIPYIRGGDNVSRQINDLLPPGSPVDRLVVVEVYTPGGNWSSYPPHKHDRHIEDPRGNLVEADLEEIYYYQIDRPDGYAFQWVYTDERSPLHQAGQPIDAVLRVENCCAVLVPEGYHPVVSAPGYMTYYLNVLAGSAQSLANQDDPRFTWVKQTYRHIDQRVPIY
jgi:5-deoxy-glucuronate isomerase